MGELKISLATLHTDGRGDGGKYRDDKIDDLLDGFFSHRLMFNVECLIFPQITQIFTDY